MTSRSSGGRSQGTSPGRKFSVAPSTVVRAVALSSDTPKPVRDQFADLVEALEKDGCRVAGYRLSGPEPWPRFCCRQLGYSYRAIVVFVDNSTIRIIELSPHTNDNSPYTALANLLDLPDPAGHGGGHSARVDCCDSDASPPLLDADFRDLVEALARRRRA